MRLIHFTAADGWRGHEQMIIYLYEGFRDSNIVENQWIICRNDSIIKKIALEKGMNILAFDFKSEYDLKFAKKLKNISKQLEADIVLIHSSKAHTIGVFSKLLFGMKSKIVLCRTMIERVDTNFFRKWKYNYKGIKKIICVSQPVVDVLKFAVKDHSKLTIVGSQTDCSVFKPKEKEFIFNRQFSIPDDYKIIGNIGAFVAVKDHITFVNTVEVLIKRKIKAKFVLIGDGPLEDSIKNLIKQKKLQNEIFFTGFRNDIPTILPELDLFLFTSKNEATGGVILEAYACKVPSIAAKAGGTSEILIDGKTGFLAEVGNPDDFADKVELILNNIQLQEEFKENGYKFLINNFTKEIISKKMFDELNKVHLESKI